MNFQTLLPVSYLSASAAKLISPDWFQNILLSFKASIIAMYHILELIGIITFAAEADK